VTIVTHQQRLGGVGYVLRKFPVLSETFILNEILALERLGLTVHVFPLQPARDPRFHEGVARLKATIHHVPGVADWRTLIRHNRRLAGRHRKRYLRQFVRVLRAGRPFLLWRFLQAGYVADRARRLKLDHLHAHFANRATTVAYLASGILRTPFSFTAHAFDIYQGSDRRVLARKMRAAEFTVTVTEYNRSYLRSLLKGAPVPIELVRNGIDLHRFAPSVIPPAGPFTIVAVARLVEKKGLPILIEACRLLRDRCHLFRCRIVGKGAQRPLLERLIRDWNLEDRVELLPPHTQEEIVGRYHEAHLLALPCIVGEDGNRDGLPVSIVEALACGVPVVSTPVNGVPEVVEDGVNGLLVPEGDAAALADVLESLMLDPERLERLRAAARPSMARAFDEEHTARQLRGLFLHSGRRPSDAGWEALEHAVAPAASTPASAVLVGAGRAVAGRGRRPMREVNR
jgi:glycosyltransferase involved in cell wall biosynthesis